MLDGKDGHEIDRKNLTERCRFPDPSVGLTNKKGDPFCYITNTYVQLSGGEITAIYIPMKDKKIDRITILTKAQTEDFATRMQKRSLREELVKSGFSEEQMDVETLFQMEDLQATHQFNVPHAGLTFEYEVVGCNRGTQRYPDYGDYYYTTIYNRDYFQYLGNVNGILSGEISGRYIPSGIPDQKTKRDTFMIVSKGWGWNDTTIGGYSCDAVYCSYTDSNRESYREGYKGWAPRYVKHFLKKVDYNGNAIDYSTYFTYK